MLLLPLRVAGVAASSIPITIFISLGLMYAFGLEINTVTLAALLVVLGMIVDNSIVIVDSYLEKLDHGISRWDAAIESAKEYFKAILSATLAISVTFFPFLFTMTGQTRDFLDQFPWTILITLSVSLAVAVLLIPFLQYFFIRKGLKQQEEKPGKKSKSILDRLQAFYNMALEKNFKHPFVALGITLFSVLVGFYLFSTLPQRLLPIAERDQFAVEIYLPNGSSLEETTAVCNDLENILRKDERVVSVTSFVGSGSPRFHTSYAPKPGGKNFGQFIVNTTSSKDTEAMLDDYMNSYAYHYPNAFVKFKQLDYLAVNADIEVRISNDNLEYLKETIGKLEAELKKLDGALRVHSDFEEPLPGINITIDPVEANRLGISEPMVALSLASRYGGLPITTLWEGDYQVPLKLKSEWENGDPNASDIANEYITGLLSPSVPLTQVANIEPNWYDGKIVRRNGIKTATIRVDLKRGEKVGFVQADVEAVVNNYFDQNPSKETIVSYGGAKENDDEQMPTIIMALCISIAIIFFILVFHFKKVSLATLVLASTSLCFFGASIGLHIMGLNMGVTVILGLVSLIGIIVRNGIIMFDYTEELRFRHGMSVKEAALEAGKRRMRPIFLTSAAASMGVIPMIISKSPLWCPMGTTICFGTLISMFFILISLPILYWFCYKGQDKKLNNTDKL
jgi:multidrug efflux pump subunit AcrB